MSTTALQTLAFLLLLAALPLTSLGTENDLPVVWWLGLVSLLLGGLIPPAVRFGLGEADDEQEEA